MNTDLQSDLAFLRRIVEDSRRRLAVDASPFLVWGVAVVLGIAAEYALGGRLLPAVWIWAVVVAAAWLATAVLWHRRRRLVGARSRADRVLGSLWTGCWVSMSVVGFGGYGSGQLEGPAITGSLAAVLGAGYFATAVLVDHPPVRWLACGWWVTALAVYLAPAAYGLALFGVAMLFLQVVPAWGLRRKWLGSAHDG